jgi:hypothetical protein
MKSPKPSVERLLVVLGGLALSSCDQKQESPKAEPAASASAPVAVAPPPSAPAEPSAKVEAKEVSPAASASGGKEKKCAPGGCAPGACG